MRIAWEQLLLPGAPGARLSAEIVRLDRRVAEAEAAHVAGDVVAEAGAANAYVSIARGALSIGPGDRQVVARLVERLAAEVTLLERLHALPGATSELGAALRAATMLEKHLRVEARARGARPHRRMARECGWWARRWSIGRRVPQSSGHRQRVDGRLRSTLVEGDSQGVRRRSTTDRNSTPDGDPGVRRRRPGRVARPNPAAGRLTVRISLDRRWQGRAGRLPTRAHDWFSRAWPDGHLRRLGCRRAADRIVLTRGQALNVQLGTKRFGHLEAAAEYPCERRRPVSARPMNSRSRTSRRRSAPDIRPRTAR